MYHLYIAYCRWYCVGGYVLLIFRLLCSPLVGLLLSRPAS